MKPCFKCLRSLPLTCFYVHAAMKDGHLGKCKECARADVTKRRTENVEYVREYDRVRAKLPHRRAGNRRRVERDRLTYPVAYAARVAVNNAVRDRRLSRQPCVVCGNPRSHGHHEDYAQPLEVVWLCAVHHSERHKKESA